MRSPESQEKAGLKYLLLDMPAEHEIEEQLSTECAFINSLLTNQTRKNSIKWVHLVREDSMKYYLRGRHNPNIVHLSGHAGEEGLELLGGVVKWEVFADHLAKHLKPLEPDEERVLVFSCCHSQTGFKKMQDRLKGHFTGAYCFHDESVDFDLTMVVWGMFYFRMPPREEKASLIRDINSFMKRDVIDFWSFKTGRTLSDQETINRMLQELYALEKKYLAAKSG